MDPGLIACSRELLLQFKPSSCLRAERGQNRNEVNPRLVVMHAGINEVHDLVTENTNEFQITWGGGVEGKHISKIEGSECFDILVHCSCTMQQGTRIKSQFCKKVR